MTKARAEGERYGQTPSKMPKPSPCVREEFRAQAWVDRLYPTRDDKSSKGGRVEAGALEIRSAWASRAAQSPKWTMRQSK